MPVDKRFDDGYFADEERRRDEKSQEEWVRENSRKPYAIRETANGVSRYFIMWDYTTGGKPALHDQIDLDNSIQRYDEDEAQNALKSFRAECRKVGKHLKSELVKVG